MFFNLLNDSIFLYQTISYYMMLNHNNTVVSNLYLSLRIMYINILLIWKIISNTFNTVLKCVLKYYVIAKY